MARPQKNGLDYFSLDVDFFSDPKVKILKSRYGVDGVACYLYLLCEAYKNGYYVHANEDFFYVMAEDLHMGIDKVKQVLAFLLERSMFDKQLFQSDAALTSAGIQKRFQLAVRERAKKRPVEVSGLWLLKKAETEPYIKVAMSSGYSGKNDSYSGKNDSYSREQSLKESKVKESKVNNTHSDSTAPRKGKEKKTQKPDMYSGDPELHDAFLGFVEMRKMMKKPMTDRAIRMEMGKLNKLATVNGAFDRNLAIAILDQSVMRSWQGLYPLKEDGGATAQSVKPVGVKNSFHNFEQRNYDYQDLEKKLLGRRT